MAFRIGRMDHGNALPALTGSGDSGEVAAHDSSGKWGV
ncbi:hypothetical protein I603_0906 [Erythrobacter dokdonensis DSW-74]|uniref:Uncharacterized protein n=1 Tax=Erythrobacter dokdonensis DSW-74 TaxID=1300349 RepID=A0A1A7BG02_9SPHN|nr:hypothetical protein I603_0906 [Erythrobacter dokdonensis DSW-74]